MNRRAFGAIGLATFLVLGSLALWQLQRRIDRHMQAVQQDAVTLHSPNVIKKLSLEYAPLMGAIYWTRAVQYYGEKHRLRDPNLEALWPLLDISTTLDPNLTVAYRFGSIFLSDAPPRGAGRPDLAVRLLERGIQTDPGNWRLYQDLGNVYYFDAKDYPKASQAFLQGSKNPQAAIWMKIMAARIAAEGESLETSYFLWQQVYETTSDAAIKKNAQTHVKLVKAAMDCKAIDALAERYENQMRRPPRQIGELLQAGLLKSIPVDPEGYPYVLGEDSKAELNLQSPLLEEKLTDQRFRPSAGNHK